jgi:RimJ/RimL family protein N-acetyltransferase
LAENKMSEGASSLGPRTLPGEFIALEPLSDAHYDGLRKAASNAAIWEYLPIIGSEDFDRWWKGAHSEPNRICFAVKRLEDRALVGSTSYLANTPVHARVEIGWTWYVPEVQGTAVNPEAKLLLLQNAFDGAGYHRVELKTDSRNSKSNAAILKLGAKREGVLREHMWMPKGYWRDTVYYSIVRSEWPDVRAILEKRLGR